MSGKRIEVIVSPDGEVKIDAIGFQGRECLAATAGIEAALGQPATRKAKPELARTAAVNKARARR